MEKLLPTNALYFIATIAVILGAVRTFHFFRARSMRALAASRGFRYIGPTAPPQWWWNPAHLVIPEPLPAWIAHFRPAGRRMRQIWNVIEGQKSGIRILIFDSVIGEYRGGQPCTLIAVQSEQNPFGLIAKAEPVVQSHGWTVLNGTWFLWFSWTMGTTRIGSHLDRLREGPS